MINNQIVIEKLIAELSMTQIALGQLICNVEREYKSADMRDIAKSWLARSAQMAQPEWIAGTVAMKHFLKTRKTKVAKAATEILSFPHEYLYNKNAKLYRGMIRRRGTKSESIYQVAQDNLKAEMLPPKLRGKIKLNGGTRGVYRNSRTSSMRANHNYRG